jgi:membrane fusion protein, heavy metal efflux system
MKRCLLAVALVTSFFCSCSHSEKTADEPPADGSEKKKIIEVTADARAKSGISVEAAGPAVLMKTLKLNGKIVPDEERMAHVNPRFAGIVKSIAKRLGDQVKAGESLAVIESNESLQPYEVKAEIDGTVINKDIALGEFVDPSKTIFVVADLQTVWVDFSIYRQESESLQVGQTILIQPSESAEKIESTISYISPFGTENTQTTLARAVVPNSKGQLRPGLFVEGEVILEEVRVPVAVKASALQNFEEKPVVFVAVGKGFEVREVAIGARDDEHVEIKSGIAPGEKYAAENSFLLKSELARPAPGEE